MSAVAIQPDQSLSFEHILSPVAPSFHRLEQRIAQELSSQVPLIEQVAQYTISSGGKRLRPLLTLLSAQACGYSSGPDHETMAIIVEFLHTASLLHDDVVDESPLRRGRASAHSKWGHATSVLVGDFIYARAFQMLVDLKNLDLQSTVANAIKTITEGEIFQLLNKGNSRISEEDYFQIIHGKTAAMFLAAAKTGAQIANADQATQNALAQYANHLGCAFQIIDDLLDYTGELDTLGKELGEDLAEGKVTLPLIYALKLGSNAEQTLIQKAIESGEIGELEPFVLALERSGALKATRERALQIANKATASLDPLPNTEAKHALKKLVTFSIQRHQ